MTQAIEQTMQQAVAMGVFPAASLAVGLKGELIYQGNFGKSDAQTLFDIASLTKPIATATLSMILIQEGKLKTSDTVYQWLGGARHPFHKKMTVSHLLNHTSGLPAWRPYYREIPIDKIGTPEAKQHILTAIFEEPLFREPGTQCEYSDLGFILLGKILEQASQKSLNQLFEEKIAKPLGLKKTFYRLLHSETSTLRDSFSPTEDCPWRGRVICGEVHDQNAFAMGGVAGHAGLFATATDIHQFIIAFLNQKIIHSILDFQTPTLLHSQTYLLGWDTPSFGTSSSGRYFSPHSIGHLGYTGCSMWMDLDKEFWVILLTNRIHPSTANEKIKAFRPRIHNLVWKELLNGNIL